MSWNNLAYLDEDEEIDRPDQPCDALAASMGDVACTNRWFGGTAAVIGPVSKMLRGVAPGAEIRVLDIGTGTGDIPAALVRWGTKHGIALSVVGVDNHPDIIRLALQTNGPVRLIRASAVQLPFQPRSFDIAVCALAFHHFGWKTSISVLRAMDQLTTRGFVVSDLRRDALTLWGVRAALHLARTHPFTRHDGPASVRRAWTPMEYRKMIGLSGVQGVSVASHLYYRILLVQHKRHVLAAAAAGDE